MKLNKFISLAVASLSVLAVSCTPDVTASGDASVGFSGPEFETGLGSQYFNIPIVTEGKSTVYPIKVQIEVAEYDGEYAAVEDVDYMITSKEILVASPEATPSVEVKVINPNNVDALYFKLKIVSQENAQSISQDEVLVMCQKSDLDRVCGTYTVTGIDSSNSAVTQTWVVSNDGSKIQIAGMFNEAGYIEGEMEDGVITFPLGSGTPNMIGAYNFTGIGTAYVGPVIGSLSADGVSINDGTALNMYVSDDYNSLTLGLENNQMLVLCLFTYDDACAFMGYLYDYLILDEFTITKQ